MSEEQQPKKDADKELSELLDSALSDFSKEPEKKPSDDKNVEEKGDPEENSEEVQEWSQEFLRQAAEQFESSFTKLLGETNTSASDNVSMSPEQVQDSLQKMAEAAQQALANPEITDSSSYLASTISQTLKGLSEGAENLQNPFSEQDLLNMFKTNAEGGMDQNSFLPVMQGMLQSLLSKDVLYPSLKDILEKFPEWLQQNESKLTPEEKQKYQNQQKLMEDICKELESESEADSVESQRERFEKVLGLMQKLQDYGQPPAELVGDVPPGLQFDPMGNPEQCSLM